MKKIRHFVLLTLWIVIISHNVFAYRYTHEEDLKDSPQYNGEWEKGTDQDQVMISLGSGGLSFVTNSDLSSNITLPLVEYKEPSNLYSSTDLYNILRTYGFDVNMDLRIKLWQNLFAIYSVFYTQGDFDGSSQLNLYYSEDHIENKMLFWTENYKGSMKGVLMNWGVGYKVYFANRFDAELSLGIGFWETFYHYSHWTNNKFPSSSQYVQKEGIYNEKKKKCSFSSDLNFRLSYKLSPKFFIGPNLDFVFGIKNIAQNKLNMVGGHIGYSLNKTHD